MEDKIQDSTIWRGIDTVSNRTEGRKTVISSRFGNGPIKTEEKFEAQTVTLDHALLQGVFHFNAHEYFKAHEAWEDWWRQRTGAEKRHAQGLVQVAVAMHHATRGNKAGAQSVIRRALKNLEGCPDVWFGIDALGLRRNLRRAIEEMEQGREVTHFDVHHSE